MKTASAYKLLTTKEKQFLSDISKDIAMLVGEPEKWDYFREQLTKFSNQWKAYKRAYESDRKGKWQPSMGKPSNPMGTIWPIVYRDGWRVWKKYDPKNLMDWYPCIADVRLVLGAYALLAVIHDNVLPHCPPIAKDIFPKELAQEIWRNLVTGVDVEGPIDFKKWAVWARKSKIGNFLNYAEKDIAEKFGLVKESSIIKRPKKGTNLANKIRPTETGGVKKVIITELWKQVATEVEDLISQNSYGVERFKEQIRVLNRDWQPYWQSLCDELPPYEDPTGKEAKPGYEYEPHLQCWYPKDVKRPPDPTVGECEDKLPYYYTVLAVIYDSVKGTVAPFLLCDGILDYAAFKWTQLAANTRDRDMLYTGIKWVKSDLAKGTGARAEASGGKGGYGKETDKQADLAKVPISELIKQGESHRLEFKETLEYDVKQKRNNRDLTKECLKAIAAFLNTDGGTLLIGVKDNGEITGIERDLPYVQKKNLDGFQLKLRDLIRNRFEPGPIGKLNVLFEKLPEVTICRVDVEKSEEVVHLDNQVYVRDGNTTQKLEGRPLTDWVRQRGQVGRG